MSYARSNYKRNYIPKYSAGGYTAATTVGNTLGAGLMQTAYNSNGSVNDGRYIAGNSLSRASQGAALGTAIAPGIGTAIGAGVGAIGGAIEGVMGSKKLMKNRDDAKAAQDEYESQQAEAQAQQDKQQQEYAKIQQDNYNSAYYSANPMKGYNDSSIYAKGGKLCMYPDGGQLKPIASDVVKAEGDTHAEGGITLQNQGKPFAEVEDQEIIKDNKVLSDRIELPNGNTMAQEGEKWAKIKGKNEKRLTPSADFRTKNSANRMAEFADKKIDQIYNIQEAYKAANGIDNPVRKFSPGGKIGADESSLDEMPEENLHDQFSRSLDPDGMSYDERQAHEAYWNSDKSGGYTSDPSGSRTSDPSPDVNPNKSDWSNGIMKGAQLVTPFLDNMYNANLINNTPKVPLPVKRTYQNLTAMPMKTTYDASSDLSSANNDFRAYTNNINNNVSNSNVARANNLTAYSNTLKQKNAIYQNKTNMETQLQNANSQNIQNVNNQNAQNRQNIDNYNNGLQDQYNYNNYSRANDIMSMKSANVANAVEDSSQIFKDYNNSALDKERMAYDYAKYNPKQQAAISRRLKTKKTF